MSYGRQRVWGTIGFGVTASLAGYTMDLWSHGEIYKSYTPAFLLVLAFTCFDLICCGKLEVIGVAKRKRDERIVQYAQSNSLTSLSLALLVIAILVYSLVTAAAYVGIDKHSERCMGAFEIQAHRHISVLCHSRRHPRQFPHLLFVLVNLSFSSTPTYLSFDSRKEIQSRMIY